MPTRSAKPCAHPGCGVLVRGTYCTRCQAKKRRREDQERGSSSDRGYGGGWKKRRARILKRDPWCRCTSRECHHQPGRCGRKSSHVDHVVPKREGGSDDDSNLQGLCYTCHNSGKQREEKSA